MALFSISIGETESFVAMRKIHSFSGVVFQYTFLIFQGFIMINIFLAIINDAFAVVTEQQKQARSRTLTRTPSLPRP